MILDFIHWRPLREFYWVATVHNEKMAALYLVLMGGFTALLLLLWLGAFLFFALASYYDGKAQWAATRAHVIFATVSGAFIGGGVFGGYAFCIVWLAGHDAFLDAFTGHPWPCFFNALGSLGTLLFCFYWLFSAMCRGGGRRP
jgi:hypothetical protein